MRGQAHRRPRGSRRPHPRLLRPQPRLPAELVTRAGRRAVVVQPYLPEVVGGNKRIFVLDGEPQAAVFRYPQRGDFRIGEPAEAAPLTARDRHICRRLAPALARNGLRIAGLDVIGPYLIEVNLTSPGALRKADALLGTNLCADVVDGVLDRSESWGDQHDHRRHLHRRPRRPRVPARRERVAAAGRAGQGRGRQYPGDEADPLFIAIRAHANAAEYVPTLIVLFLLVSWRSPGAWTAALIVAATAARLLHAAGMLLSPTLAKPMAPRLIGATGTYVAGVALAVMSMASV